MDEAELAVVSCGSPDSLRGRKQRCLPGWFRGQLTHEINSLCRGWLRDHQPPKFFALIRGRLPPELTLWFQLMQAAKPTFSWRFVWRHSPTVINPVGWVASRAVSYRRLSSQIRGSIRWRIPTRFRGSLAPWSWPDLGWVTTRLVSRFWYSEWLCQSRRIRASSSGVHPRSREADVTTDTLTNCPLSRLWVDGIESGRCSHRSS